jgi:2-polyprenyl-3-methyl-5-hydroxy-6-metoxy-1,4-benzoquinol methylase
MAYMDFVKLYAADVKSTPEKLLAQTPQSFPISSNARGEALVSFLQRAVDIDLRQIRVLDVGCAYGGLSIAMAQANALVSAVDVSAKFIEYARTNIKGVADIDTKVMDASSIDMRRAFEPHSFDLILLNDVLEHIYDTTSLIANLDYLLSDKGSIYFKVPNGFSPRFALSEGHRKIFGLTLLDPDCWFHLYPKRASIFYRPINHFNAIFSYYGFTDRLYIDEEEVFRRFSKKKLKAGIKQIYDHAKTFEYPDATVKHYLRAGIKRFRDEYEYDSTSFNDDFVKFKYGSYFFTGFASRPGAGLKARGETKQIDNIGLIASRDSSGWPVKAPAQEEAALS